MKTEMNQFDEEETTIMQKIGTFILLILGIIFFSALGYVIFKFLQHWGLL